MSNLAKARSMIAKAVSQGADMVVLPELVDRFINFAASQLNLYYNHKVIRTFFAGLATSKIIINQLLSINDIIG